MIEANILASATKLEKAFLTANQELRVTFGARVKDVEEHEEVVVRQNVV